MFELFGKDLPAAKHPAPDLVRVGESVRGHAPTFRILQEEGVERYTQLTNIARTSQRMTVAVLRRQLFGRHVAVLHDVVDDGPGALGCDGLEPF
jgi:hypothetical protein